MCGNVSLSREDVGGVLEIRGHATARSSPTAVRGAGIRPQRSGAGVPSGARQAGTLRAPVVPASSVPLHVAACFAKAGGGQSRAQGKAGVPPTWPGRWLLGVQASCRAAVGTRGAGVTRAVAAGRRARAPRRGLQPGWARGCTETPRVPAVASRVASSSALQLVQSPWAGGRTYT